MMTWLPIVTEERISILFVWMELWFPIVKLELALLAKLIGIMTPSPIVAPRLRAILLARAYLKFCFQRTIRPIRYRNWLRSWTFFSYSVRLSSILFRSMLYVFVFEIIFFILKVYIFFVLIVLMEGNNAWIGFFLITIFFSGCNKLIINNIKPEKDF